MNDDYKNLLCNEEYLEAVYTTLKGEDKELKRDVVKAMLEKLTGVEYESIYLNKLRCEQSTAGGW
jgi:hypothetical protein